MVVAAPPDGKGLLDLYSPSRASYKTKPDPKKRKDLISLTIHTTTLPTRYVSAYFKTHPIPLLLVKNPQKLELSQVPSERKKERERERSY
jgi:hypothetical protein